MGISRPARKTQTTLKYILSCSIALLFTAQRHVILTVVLLVVVMVAIVVVVF